MSLVLPLGLPVVGPRSSRGAQLGLRRYGLDDASWVVWTRAWGAWSPDGTWSRNDVVQAASDDGVKDSDCRFGELVHEGLLLEIAKACDAATVRMLPLLAGLGQTQPNGGQYALGQLAEEPLVHLGAAEFRLWQRGPTHPSLDRALLECEIEAEPLPTLARLLARGVIYLLPTELEVAQ